MARRALWILGIGAIAVVAGAVGLAVFALDRAPGWIADRIEGPTGRASRIGSLDVDWSWTPDDHADRPDDRQPRVGRGGAPAVGA